MADESIPWDQQEGETNRWFRRFCAYRLRGPGRSVAGTCNAERVARGRKESRCAPGSWRRAAEQWQWKARAEAWDKHLADEANAAIEARWATEIMGKTEVLGRLSEQGRANPEIFFIKDRLPILDEDGQPIKGKKGEILTYEVVDINWETFREKGHLIKSIVQTKYGPKIELHDKQGALALLGKYHQLFTENIDLTSGGKPLATNMENLSDEQLRSALSRLAQIGMALAGGDGLHGGEGSPENHDPEG